MKFFNQAVKTQNQSGFVSYPEVEILIELFDNFFESDEFFYTKHKIKAVVARNVEIIETESVNAAKKDKIIKIMKDIIEGSKVQFADFVSFIREYASMIKAENQDEIVKSARSLTNRIFEIKRLLKRECGVEIEVEEERNRKFIKFKFPTENSEDDKQVMDEE